MGHPAIENQTRFAFEPLFVTDEEGRPIVAPLVKATFAIGADGRLSTAEEQHPIDFPGTFWGEPGESSYRFEPETAFVKLATDVVLVGHAWADRRDAPHVDVELRVGDLAKTVRAHGDRHWLNGLFGARISEPEPFEKIPLSWERAFGGWDRDAEDEEEHEAYPLNRHGTGYHRRGAKFVEGSPLPNLELPKKPLKSFHGRVPPACFGFTSCDWEPRVELAGTYDEKWRKSRFPLLPKDFDRRFFNAASDGMIAKGYLRGDEPVEVANATPEGRLAFHLPGLPAPEVLFSLSFADDRTVATKLDTVVVDTDTRQLILLWRGHTQLRTGPHDVSAIRITMEPARELAGIT